jgi:hypothetical protein
MGHWFAHGNDSYLADRATNDAAPTMNLTDYYKRSRWSRALCHIIPMCVALCLGALAIMTIDRDGPVSVVWGKIIPPEVIAGQPVTFHYGSIRHHDYGGHIKRWVVDVHDQIFNLSDTGVSGDNLPMYVEGEVVKKFDVPCGIAVGPATYHSDAALYAKWNFMQRLFPVHREIHYSFVVQNGSFDGVCAGHGPQQGTQGLQGVQGIPGEAAVLTPRPRVIRKVWLEPTIMTPGGKFTVNIDVTINQICPGETHWSIVRTSDGSEVSKIIQKTLPTTLGENHLANTWALSPDIPRGEYYYIATIYEFCGPDRTTYMATTEHIPFTVK